MVVPGIETTIPEFQDLALAQSPDLVEADLVAAEGPPTRHLKRIQRLDAGVHQPQLPDVVLADGRVVRKDREKCLRKCGTSVPLECLDLGANGLGIRIGRARESSEPDRRSSPLRADESTTKGRVVPNYLLLNRRGLHGMAISTDGRQQHGPSPRGRGCSGGGRPSASESSRRDARGPISKHLVTGIDEARTRVGRVPSRVSRPTGTSPIRTASRKNGQNEGNHQEPPQGRCRPPPSAEKATLIARGSRITGHTVATDPNRIFNGGSQHWACLVHHDVNPSSQYTCAFQAPQAAYSRN